METQFRKELEPLINKYSKENGSDTPDFILARYLENVLDNFDAAVKERDEWYGRTPKLSEMDGVPFPTVEQIPPIDLDAGEPLIDYDSTGNPPPSITDIKRTGDPPDWMLNQPTTSHKPDIHPLSKELRDDQISGGNDWEIRSC